MGTMTEKQAEKARRDLAAYEEERARVARQEENAKRAATLEVVSPLAELLNGKLAGIRDEIEEAARALPPEEWDLANLLRNVVVTATSAISRVQRRVDDNQPAPEPPAMLAATPAV